ncbi:MAG TPA: hypothetical protein DEQ61_08310 [Streptomyces sp.]|nr:hypothetical protein [Streptomyces sp.]
MTDFDATDMREIRQQGDLRAFLRQQMRPTRTAGPTPQERQPKPPGHIPGGWPAGTRPPEPDPDPPPDHAWQTALEEHRAWIRAGSPDGGKRTCECRPCQLLDDTDDTAPRSQP